MNPISRVMRYAQAQLQLGRLNRLTESLADNPQKLISTVFGYCEGFLQPIQINEELESLLGDVRTLKPKTVLEIGTSMGGTLYLWTRLATRDALIVSVDLPGGKFGGGYSPLRTPLYRRFAGEQQRLILLRASSHDSATLDKVKGIFGSEPIDLLFIDGDHTYEGVKQDWEMYSPLVRPGGLIVFHDIAGNYEDTQVKRLWDVIKVQYPHREYMVHPRGHYGIGVLFK